MLHQKCLSYGGKLVVDRRMDSVKAQVKKTSLDIDIAC